nr:3-isopropylmalate dehydrogenase [uncultured Bacillus sp.]
MASFFIMLMFFLIIIANIIGFIIYKKMKNLYLTAFTILLLAFLFGLIGGALALFIIQDGFAIFYGFQLGYYLLINSSIVFIIAILATIIKKYSGRKI